jgi:geranylgeranyl diphosphate synthase type II
MIGGQMMDIYSDSDSKQKEVEIINLIKLHTLKTGNIIMMAARIGSISGKASEEDIDLATNYAKNIGLAFQIIDDILDSTGDSALLGKNTGSDEKNAKTTFLNVLNETDAYEYAKKLTVEAILCLDKLKEKLGDSQAIELLEMLAKYLLSRKA